jgi:hypothetical protein
MAMRGNLVPAKKMVLALTQLIRSKFPRDFVAVVGFGETAQELRVEDIPALSIDYAYGTNLQHALALSRHLMRNERGERQIVVVTDGEPTAHLMPNGEPFFSWPPVRETWKRPWPRCCAAPRPVSRSTPSPSTSSAASFPSSNRSPASMGASVLHVVNELGSYALDDFVRHRRAVSEKNKPLDQGF